MKKQNKQMNKQNEEMKRQNEGIEKQTQDALKQKHLMTGIKSCLRNFALSLTAFCDEDDVVYNVEEDGNGIQEFSEKPQTCQFTAPNAQDYLQGNDNKGSPVTIVNCTGNYSSTQIPSGLSFGAGGSSERFSNEVGQKTNEEEPVDLDVFKMHNNDDKDSSYVPDDESEEEPDQDMEDELNYHGPGTSTSKSFKAKDPFPCRKCSKSFKLKKYLTKHMQRVHFKKFKNKCHFCTKVFFDVGELKQHVQSAHEGVRYQCAHCPGKFISLKNAERHERSVHEEGGPPTQQCKVCGAHLNSERSLQSHMSKMHKKSGITQKRVQCLRKKKIPEETSRRIIFQCQQCPASFPEREQLHSHQRRVHGIDTNPGVETEN